MRAAARHRRDAVAATAIVALVALAPAVLSSISPGGRTDTPLASALAGQAPTDSAPTAAPLSGAPDPVRFELASARRASSVSRSSRSWFTPVAAYRLTARFGESGPSWIYRHTGLDFRAPWGTPVRAVTDGRVVAVAYHPVYGRIVVLQTGSGVTLWYCHLSHAAVSEGERVDAGQRIGRIGTTGNSSGPHLHFEVRVADRPTDPAYYLFGAHRGRTKAPPGWLPPQPVTTVAQLAAQSA